MLVLKLFLAWPSFIRPRVNWTMLVLKLASEGHSNAIKESVNWTMLVLKRYRLKYDCSHYGSVNWTMLVLKLFCLYILPKPLIVC